MTQDARAWLIERYGPVAQAIAETFGSDCEVVLHDLSHPMTSVIHVQNGHVTGRSIGMPFNHLISTVLRSKRLKGDVLANYRADTPNGKPIKSTTVIIRDDQGTPVGALCININLERFVTGFRLLDEMVRVEDLDDTSENETDLHDDNVWTILNSIIDRVIDSNGPVSTMDKQQKVTIVRFLDEKGVFLIKGSVDRVARALNVSRYSVYNYIDEVRGANKDAMMKE